MSTFWEHQKFDSKIFGFKVAKILLVKSKANLEKILSQFEKERIKYATFRFPADKIKKLTYLREHGFYLIDSIISFERSLSDFNVKDEDLLKKPSLKDAADISKNISGLYDNTRIYNDPFVAKKGDDYYKKWIGNSIKKEAADAILVAKKKSVEGFITLKRIDGETISIPLVGVFPKFQGKGLGKSLVLGALIESKRMKATKVTIDTQTSNIAAIRTYLSCGFKPIESSFTFAWHKN